MLRQGHRQQRFFEQAVPGDVIAGDAPDFQQDLLLALGRVPAVVGYVPAEEDTCLHLHGRGEQLLGHAEEGGRCIS